MSYTEDDTFKRLYKPPIEEIVELIRGYILEIGNGENRINSDLFDEFLADHNWDPEEYAQAYLESIADD